MNVRIDVEDGPAVVIATMTGQEARQLAKALCPEADVRPDTLWLMGGPQREIASALLAAANEVQFSVNR